MRCQKNSNRNRNRISNSISNRQSICKKYNIQNERITAIKYMNADSPLKWV